MNTVKGYKETMNEISLTEKEHHIQQQLCKTRPAYRQGRNLTAVKVYTVNSESQHLFIYDVPQINLRNELKSLCMKYGKVISIHVVADHPTELFTECYHVWYDRIQSARIAKRLLDNKSFYGGVLHVCYSPECESLEETRAKMKQRTKDVTSRIGIDDQDLLNTTSQSSDVKLEEYAKISKSQIKKRRKHGDGFIDGYSKTFSLSHQDLSDNKRFKGKYSSSNYDIPSGSND